MSAGPATRAPVPQWELRFRKWDGTTSKIIPLEALGDDRFGRWFRWRAGAAMIRPTRSPVCHRDDHVVLVPTDGAWIARWSLDGDFALYCDVTTRPVVVGTVVEAVDLDLDVVRFHTGRVAVVDQEQFDQRRATYGYPPQLVDEALATAAWLFDAVRRRAEPFALEGAGRLGPLSAAARAGIVQRLGARTANADLSRWVDEAAATFRDASLRAFVPVLVERAVRRRLAAAP